MGNRREHIPKVSCIISMFGTLLAVVGFFATAYGLLVLYDPSFIMWPADAVLTVGEYKIEAELFPKYLTIVGVSAFVVGFALSSFARCCTWCCRR